MTSPAFTYVLVDAIEEALLRGPERRTYERAKVFHSM
jgi:hypothetical protein